MPLCLREWSAMPQYQNLLPFNMQLFGVFTAATKVSVSILFQNTSATGMMNGLPMRSSRTQLWQNFFTYRVVKLWNNLPEEVVMAPTVNCFKGCFDRHSADNRYSMEWKYRRAENAQWDNHPDIIQLDNTMVNIGQQAFCLYKKKMKMTMWLWHIGWFACSSSTLDCLVRQCLMRHLLHVQIFV